MLRTRGPSGFFATMYEVFEHTADLGLRVRAMNWPDLMQDAARGLFSVIVANLSTVRPVHRKELTIVGNEPDYLLLDWLSELLFVFETDQLLLVDFDVRQHQAGFTATCFGEPVDPSRHEMDHEVKAITYHALTARQEPDGSWVAEVIVDI